MKKNILCFIGGMAAAAVVKYASSSPKTRQLCVKSLAAGMRASEKAKAAFQNLKEDAADLCAEAKAEVEASSCPSSSCSESK